MGKWAILAVALYSGAGAAQSLTTFLPSGSGFDFGDVGVGATATREVIFTNVSSTPQLFNGAGGGAGAFGGSQNCQGQTIAPGDSCSYFYSFTPTALGVVTGSAGGTASGDPFAFTFRGNGIEAFEFSPTGLDFGDVAVNTTSPQQRVTITNVSTSPQLFSGAGGGAGQFGGSQDCQGRTLAPGASCNFYYNFTPTAAGPVTSTTTFTANGQPGEITFTGVGGGTSDVFRPSGTAFDFGNVPVGQRETREVVFTNVTSSSQLFDGAGGGAGAFGGAQNCQGQIIAAGASCSYFYTFAPSALGSVSGSTSGTANGDPFAFSFRGAGILPYLIDTTSFDFGNVAVGTSSMQLSLRLYNVSGIARSFSLSGGGAGAFGGAQDCQGQTLAAGAFCQFYYAFMPTRGGSYAETTTIGVDGFSSRLSLRGFGVGGMTGGVPEPSTWAMMVIGAGLTGGAMRRARARRERPFLA